jgi:dipeptidyl aminopeptidase/acylaminoacyl peptidase
MMKYLLIAIGLGLTAAPLRADSAGVRLTAEKSWEFKRIGSPSLSPDGRWAVAAVATPNVKENKLESDIWIFATDGSSEQPLTTHAADEKDPVYSPDGRWIAFIAKRDADKAPQLYVLPAQGGEARRVTRVPTGVGELRWFPDSKSVAFVTRVWPELKTWDEQGKRLSEREESKMTARVWDSVPVSSWDVWVDEREAHIYRAPLDGAEPVPLTLPAKVQLTRSIPENDPGRYDISPDGTQLAFVSDSDPKAGKDNADIFLLTIGKSEVKNITASNPASDSFPRFSPDGKSLAYLRQAIPGFYGDTRRLTIVSSSGSNPRILFTDWDRSIGSFVWQSNSDRVYASIDDAGNNRIFELPLSGKPKALTTDKGFTAVNIASNAKKRLVALRSSFIEAPTLVTLDVDKPSDIRKISKINDALQKSIAWGTYESVTYKGANGADIQMWVNYPPNFDPKRKYPVFLLLHGGPHNGITDSMSWRWNAQVWAAQGYVTAWHNFHGSSGFGQAFTDSINPDWYTKPYQDTLGAAAWFQSQSWADPKRMVAGGGSYGGYLASALLGSEHPFQALIAHAAVYNLFTQYAADFGYSERRDGEFWEKPEIFQNVSPHYRAAAFKTPTLVVHGQLDYRVPVTHGIELFQTLQKKGVPSRFVYYPNENHWILKPQNSLFWYKEVSDWINRYAPADAAQSLTSTTVP